MEVRRFEVLLINLDPTIGREIKKTRPCLVISPDEMNSYISTIIVAPMTTQQRVYPTRIKCKFKLKSCDLVLDQIRTIDKSRVIKKLGQIDSKTQNKALKVLQEMFAY